MRAVPTGAAVVAALLLVACGSEPAGAPAATTGTSDTAPFGQADAGRAQDGDTLHARAERAMREGRMYAPAGDSAIEHWLAARGQAPADAALQAAIIEMQPYLLIACEQAIVAGKFDEARRLLGLMTRSTPNAPALPRLLGAIGTAEQAQQLVRRAQGAEQEAARRVAEDARRQATAAVREEAASASMADAAPPRASVAPPLAATSVAMPRQDAATHARRSDAVAASAAATNHAPAPAESTRPVASAAAPQILSRRAPRYPIIAMNRRVEGSVQVAFSINGDGSVDNARVVGAQPSGVFDRAAVEAVEGYRFEPTGRSQDSMVTINFTLPEGRG